MIDSLSGRMVIFPDGREVFIALAPGSPRRWNIGLRSAHGRVTRFVLTDEALRALFTLVDDPTFGTPTILPSGQSLPWTEPETLANAKD